MSSTKQNRVITEDCATADEEHISFVLSDENLHDADWETTRAFLDDVLAVLDEFSGACSGYIIHMKEADEQFDAKACTFFQFAWELFPNGETFLGCEIIELRAIEANVERAYNVWREQPTDLNTITTEEQPTTGHVLH